MKTTSYLRPLLLSSSLLFCVVLFAQPITGVWKGKIKSTRIELKLIKKGDSLVGTSYYYDSKDNYRRFSVKGYFDDATNNVVWWDDQLIEDHGSFSGTTGNAMMAIADFNCPGEGIMKLDGNTSLRDDARSKKLPMNLQKTGSSSFQDEWDNVLENYTQGGNDPDLIDSVALIAFGGPPSIPDGYEAPLLTVRTPDPVTTATNTRGAIGPLTNQHEEILINPTVPLTVEQKFSSRTKILQQVIPIAGDSIELRFYDNAEIDGDSIAVFLNERLLRQHILLTDRAYTIKIPVNQLGDDNELVMVAENLGSIPPNTSLMVAIVGDKRYEARLQSTEGSSALIRLVKEIGSK
ncbi:MAG: hypothetical protein ACHQET_01800 [Chitinophagales bacterium]